MIPNSVDSIGEAAFRKCTSLESITLPFVGTSRGETGTVSSVFGYIFGYGASIYSDETKQVYSGNYAGSYKMYYIPKSVKKVTITDETIIPFGAFMNCSNIVEINIPSSVTTIEAYAFRYCNKLQKLVVPKITSKVGNYALANCSNLKIYGYKDSYVEEYVKENDLDFYIIGDINNDENIDMNDAILLLQCSMFPDIYPIEYLPSVDFTDDENIDMNDAILLLQHSMFPDIYPLE